MRAQLESRGLDSKGVKNVLQQRLQEALEKEGAKIITPVPKEQPNVVVKEEIMDTSHVSFFRFKKNAYWKRELQKKI